MPVTACPAPREGWQRSQQQRTVPAVQDSRAVWAEPANPALFLCQDLLAPCTALGKVFCAQRWHWKAGSSSGTALLRWEFIFWAVCSPLWQFLSVETSLGVFPFLVWFGLKLQQKVRTETTARGSECFTMSTTSESGFSEELNSLLFPVLKIPHQVVTGDCWLVWAGLNTP